MKLSRNKLTGVSFDRARWTGGPITPEIVILHDTAGSLDKGSSAAYLAKNAAKVSVHFVVERDGTIIQQVETNRRANHAGKSTYHGRPDCNAFSIGIEIVNPGKMQRLNPSKARAWWGDVFDFSELDMVETATPEHGSGVWATYPSAQLTAVRDLLEALFAGIPSLRDITTHWYVSPGRKIDTNPLFPLEEMRGRVLGRDDPRDLAAEQQAILLAESNFVQVHSPVSPLNMRRWPSFNPNVVGIIPHGAVLPVLARGVFDGREWGKVLFDGREGWVLGRYINLMP